MKPKYAPILAILTLLSLAPAGAAESKHGVGIAGVSGIFDCEFCFGPYNFVGFSLFGKIGFDSHWGLLITYRDMDDEEFVIFGDEDSYTQWGVQAAYMWRPSKPFRPYVKFGLERTDYTSEDSILVTVSDDGTSLAVGGGFEAGSQRVAFVLDYDFTVVELFGRDSDIGNAGAGIIFKF